MFDLQEYLAVRERAGFVDRSATGKVVLAGADHQSFLHAMLTNDIAALKPGDGCYAAYLTPQGRMIADMRVLELGDVALLDVHPTVAASLVERLEMFVFSEDVRLNDVTGAFDAIRVAGPAAAKTLAGVLRAGAMEGAPPEERLAAFRELQGARVRYGGAVAIVAATRELGVAGFDVYVEKGDGDTFRQALAAAGPVAVSAETADVLRVEAGVPEFARDMDNETIPLEAGIEARAISAAKGCYPGQEVIIRILHRGGGRVARRLVGLAVDGHLVPSPGDALAGGDKEAGRVTSAVWSPALARPIALGYVRAEFAVPGTRIGISHGESRLDATVAMLPFVRFGP